MCRNLKLGFLLDGRKPTTLYHTAFICVFLEDFYLLFLQQAYTMIHACDLVAPLQAEQTDEERQDDGMPFALRI